MSSIYKEQLQKYAREHDWSAKYIALPSFVISTACFVISIVSKVPQIAIFFAFTMSLNLFGYWVNIKMRDGNLNEVDRIDRLEKIRDLKPNK
jgi:hypothetical protein